MAVCDEGIFDEWVAVYVGLLVREVEGKRPLKRCCRRS